MEINESKISNGIEDKENIDIGKQAEWGHWEGGKKLYLIMMVVATYFVYNVTFWMTDTAI